MRYCAEGLAGDGPWWRWGGDVHSADYGGELALFGSHRIERRSVKGKKIEIGAAKGRG